MMHPLAAGAVTGSVIKRVSQGDCPTEPAHSVETLEEALIEVNRLFQAEQKVREQLETALRKHHTGIGCVNYCRTCGGHFSWQDDSRAVSFQSDRGENHG
ncbi:MAG: hypothetical protein M3N97_16740 [Pseudomonadota bacterium]|nr:hypothetical protein [Pseudomonadota bacterium]